MMDTAQEARLRELGEKLTLLYDAKESMVWLFSPQAILGGSTAAALIEQ
jgi:hypothetical protein